MQGNKDLNILKIYKGRKKSGGFRGGEESGRPGFSICRRIF